MRSTALARPDPSRHVTEAGGNRAPAFFDNQKNIIRTFRLPQSILSFLGFWFRAFAAPFATSTFWFLVAYGHAHARTHADLGEREISAEHTCEKLADAN